AAHLHTAPGENCTCDVDVVCMANHICLLANDPQCTKVLTLCNFPVYCDSTWYGILLFWRHAYLNGKLGCHHGMICC
ncbi:Unknown protein, partial [Striga hermonthica]